MTARIDIRNAYVSYFLRKAGKSRLAVEEGDVGARINVGRWYLGIAALKDITLSFKEGDRVGLIGVNGSGKTTLLQVCAGALSLQSGSIETSGRISPQFALGAGIKPELSGRRNTELKCLYMGTPQGAIPDRIEEVKELSRLGGYFELPVKSYSAGMRSRLVMSLLHLVRGDILIMDEWINATDPSLSSTIDGLQSRLVAKSKILLLASHSERVLSEWVDKIVWLNDGRVHMVGEVSETLHAYRKWLGEHGEEKQLRRLDRSRGGRAPKFKRAWRRP